MSEVKMAGAGDRENERGEKREEESTSDKPKQVHLRTATNCNCQFLQQIFQFISRTVNIVHLKIIYEKIPLCSSQDKRETFGQLSCKDGVNWAVNTRKVNGKNVDKTLSNSFGPIRSEEELGMGLVWEKGFWVHQYAALLRHTGNVSDTTECSSLTYCSGLCLSRNTGTFSILNPALTEIKSIFLE